MHLVDTCAISRISNARVAAELRRLGRQGLLATCVTVDLEVLYSAHSPVEYADIARLRTEALVDLPLHLDVGARVRKVQAAMAAKGQYRAAGVFDLLTAAIAEHHSAVLVHYDSDFEHIASITGQQTRWVAPRGRVD